MAIVYLQGCNVDPTPACPAGQEVWVTFNTAESWVETVFPPMTAAEMGSLGGAVAMVLTLAFGLSLIRRFLVGR